jgi:hypothetical protein
MQPYFFPYLGYFQLINAVDTFVIYDDVNYIKGGWINRNNILLQGQKHLFTLSLNQASLSKKINEIEILNDKIQKRKFFGNIQSAYGKAPYFETVYPLIEDIINFDEKNLAKFLSNQIKKICGYLKIDTKIVVSSEIKKNNSLKAQDKIIEICKKLNTNQYVNAIGGQELYNKEIFEDAGIELNFIKSHNIKYKQFNNEFVPRLSIIDVLMFNSPEEIRKMLDNYELL